MGKQSALFFSASHKIFITLICTPSCKSVYLHSNNYENLRNKSLFFLGLLEVMSFSFILSVSCFIPKKNYNNNDRKGKEKGH